jgi:hypothetical protein
MNLSAAVLRDVIRTVSALAKKEGLTIEKYVGVIVSFDEATATERSTLEERHAVMDALRDIVETEEIAMDPRTIVAQLGLKQCAADRAFVSYHARQLRLARTTH